jgi:predicted O-methyltransferase YrrM
MTWGELSFLAELANNLPENSIVIEIGTLCGRSTRAMADNAPNDCIIHCVDPWDYKIPLEDGGYIQVDKYTYAQFCMNLYDHIYANKVIPHISRWQDFNLPIKADLIFIDGDHTYDAVKCDIAKALDYIKPGGIITGHDYQFPTVRQAVDETFPGNKISTKETIWLTRKF